MGDIELCRLRLSATGKAGNSAIATAETRRSHRAHLEWHRLYASNPKTEILHQLAGELDLALPARLKPVHGGPEAILHQLGA
ncbi:MAG: hypothetical protein E7Z96_05415 [Actinomycetaceae bacterium]|nr:hypothetical protein [Actinomycetaceae bacterium]